jgi:hypothetical protein
MDLFLSRPSLNTRLLVSELSVCLSVCLHGLGYRMYSYLGTTKVSAGKELGCSLRAKGTRYPSFTLVAVE